MPDYANYLYFVLYLKCGVLEGKNSLGFRCLLIYSLLIYSLLHSP